MSRKELLLAQVSAYLILAKELNSLYYFQAATRTWKLLEFYEKYEKAA
jgi:hypothetical protein